jgi:hypothetical protein
VIRIIGAILARIDAASLQSSFFSGKKCTELSGPDFNNFPEIETAIFERHFTLRAATDAHLLPISQKVSTCQNYGDFFWLRVESHRQLAGLNQT